MIQKWFPSSNAHSSIKQKRVLASKIVLITSIVAFFFYAIYSLPYYGDWDDYYYHAGKAFLDPYSIEGFFNPPWMAWILAPITIFPVHLSGAIWMTLAVLLTVWSMHRLQSGMLGILLCLLSPVFIRYITSGQIGIVTLVGFILLITFDSIPAKGLGLLFMSVKPHVLGGGALSYWLNLDSRRKILVTLPLLGSFALSLLLHGFWPFQRNLNGLSPIDFSLWPYGIPVGLLMLGWSIWKNKPVLGALATYFLVPYMSPSSLFIYTAVLFSKAPKWVSIIVFVFLWVFALAFTIA